MNTTAELIKEVIKHTEASAERKRQVIQMISQEEIYTVQDVKYILRVIRGK